MPASIVEAGSGDGTSTLSMGNVNSSTMVDVKGMKIDLTHLRSVKNHVPQHSYKQMFASSHLLLENVETTWKGEL